MADIKDHRHQANTGNSQSKPRIAITNLASSKGMISKELESVDSDDTLALSNIRPSIAGNLRIGYFSTDKASQTNQSEIIDLKETTNLMSDLVQEISLLKKNMSFTKFALQADYDAKIEARSVELYNRANSHIAEIQKLHEERIKFIRHSFRTQLSDAICKISRQYHKYYNMKREVQDAKHQKEIEKMTRIREEQTHNERAQQEMLDLLQLQMENSDEKEEEELSESPPHIDIPEMERHAEEVRLLTDTISNLEDRIDEFSELLEQRTEEKTQIAEEFEVLKVKLSKEETKAAQARKEILELKIQIETGNKKNRIQLEQQRYYYSQQVNNKIQELQAEALKNAAIKRQVITKDGCTMTDEVLTKNKKKVDRDNTPVESLMKDLARYKQIEKSQKQEIIKFQKELEKTNKFWEMKVAILQQTLHSLKDEMFLRTSLQRQSAKLRHAALTYASDNPASVSAEVAPASVSSTPTRKFQLPNVICAPQPVKGEQAQEFSQGNPNGL